MSAITQEKPFKIHGIQLLTFSIQPQPAKAYNKVFFEFNVRQDRKTNADKGVIIIYTIISINESGKENTLVNLEVACGFEIHSFESIIKKEGENDYSIPHDLNIAISKMSIAISRGILFSQVRGSYLQDLTLPLLPIE
jgi:hypothetical protein